MVGRNTRTIRALILHCSIPILAHQNKPKHPNHSPFRSYGIGEIERDSRLYKLDRWFSWSVFLIVQIPKPIYWSFFHGVGGSVF
jgi:hypothetical protein